MRIYLNYLFKIDWLIISFYIFAISSMFFHVRKVLNLSPRFTASRIINVKASIQFQSTTYIRLFKSFVNHILRHSDLLINNIKCSIKFKIPVTLQNNLLLFDNHIYRWCISRPRIRVQRIKAETQIFIWIMSFYFITLSFPFSRVFILRVFASSLSIAEWYF